MLKKISCTILLVFILGNILLSLKLQAAVNNSSINKIISSPVDYFLANLVPRSPLSLINKTSSVKNVRELKQAINIANNTGNRTILVEPGIYQINQTLAITGNNIHIQGKGESPFEVVFRGNGMRHTRNVDNLIWLVGNNFHLENVTLEQVGNHLVQIASERGGDKPKFRNVVFQDAYEQLLKVSYRKSTPEVFSKQGIIESCLFRYKNGIGPNWYIGGIDAHGIQNWEIKNNFFIDIASPKRKVAEHAIHIWNQTKNNQIKGNVIINSDRGIGLGMRLKKKPDYSFSNLAGEVINNIIVHNEPKDPFRDVGIIVEDSPDTLVKGNYVRLESGYPNAIEIRFGLSQNVIVIENTVNKRIKLRNGAQATLLNNLIIE